MVAIRQRREQKVKEANENSSPSLTPSQRIGKEADEVITFEHILQFPDRLSPPSIPLY